MSFMNVLCWSPDGETLAVPGLKHDVVMYDRDTAEKLFSLKGDHTQPICFLSWSPNGKYMATSSLDKQVLIWDVNRKQDIDRQKFNERICCMAWKPIGNALAIIDVMGKFGIWDSVIPSSMKSPTEDIPMQSKNSNGLLLFDEEDEDLCASGSISDIGEGSDGESELPSRKRLREQPFSEENFDDGGGDEMDLHLKVESRKKPTRTHKENLNSVNEGHKSSIITCKPNTQEAFQPGSTPAQPGKRRFLCYTMLGSITTIEHDGYFHIEVLLVFSSRC